MQRLRKNPKRNVQLKRAIRTFISIQALNALLQCIIGTLKGHVNTSDRSPISASGSRCIGADTCSLLCDLAHVGGWETCIWRDLVHVFWVGSAWDLYYADLALPLTAVGE